MGVFAPIHALLPVELRKAGDSASGLLTPISARLRDSSVSGAGLPYEFDERQMAIDWREALQSVVATDCNRMAGCGERCSRRSVAYGVRWTIQGVMASMADIGCRFATAVSVSLSQA